MPNQIQMMNQLPANNLGLADNMQVEQSNRKNQNIDKLLSSKEKDNKLVMQVNKYIPHYQRIPSKL